MRTSIQLICSLVDAQPDLPGLSPVRDQVFIGRFATQSQQQNTSEYLRAEVYLEMYIWKYSPALLGICGTPLENYELHAWPAPHGGWQARTACPPCRGSPTDRNARHRTATVRAARRLRARDGASMLHPAAVDNDVGTSLWTSSRSCVKGGLGGDIITLLTMFRGYDIE